MPKREMSKEEYEEQQNTYRFFPMDPSDMQERFKDTHAKNSEEDEDRRQKVEELQIKLMGLIKEKSKLVFVFYPKVLSSH